MDTTNLHDFLSDNKKSLEILGIFLIAIIFFIDHFTGKTDFVLTSVVIFLFLMISFSVAFENKYEEKKDESNEKNCPKKDSFIVIIFKSALLFFAILFSYVTIIRSFTLTISHTYFSSIDIFSISIESSIWGGIIGLFVFIIFFVHEIYRKKSDNYVSILLILTIMILLGIMLLLNLILLAFLSVFFIVFVIVYSDKNEKISIFLIIIYVAVTIIMLGLIWNHQPKLNINECNGNISTIIGYPFSENLSEEFFNIGDIEFFIDDIGNISIVELDEKLNNSNRILSNKWRYEFTGNCTTSNNRKTLHLTDIYRIE